MTRRPLSAALAWLAGILILASGCMDQSPTATSLDTLEDQRAQLPANVSPLRAAAAYESGSFSALITPAGGSIDFGIGTIDFPKHAVDHPTVITASVDGSSMAVEFAPHLVFSGAQPTLCFDVGGLAATDFTVVHVKDDGTTSVVAHSSTASNVCVAPPSFSKFILAAE